jgi:putative copper export protein
MLDALAAIVKTLLYTSVLTCAGAVFAARLLVAPELECAVTHVIRRGAWLTLFSIVASTIILILRLGGAIDQNTASAILVSGLGAATAIQLLSAGLLLLLMQYPATQSIRLASAALLMFSFALSGHAPTMGFVTGFIVFVHASAAAWWIGSLWLLRHACGESDFNIVAHAVHRFSSVAMSLIGVLLLAGLSLLYALLRFDGMRPLSVYEQVAAVKIAIVAVVLSVAAYNKFLLTPRLAAGDASAVSTLRTSIHVELVLIAAVLAATAILTTYTSPE